MTITDEHIHEIIDLHEAEYVSAGLHTLAKETRYETVSQTDLDDLIVQIMTGTKDSVDHPTIEEIIKFVVLQGRITRDQLKEKFALSENNQLRPILAILSNEKFLKRGRGFYPTAKMTQLYKLLVESSRLS